jgi:glyoxylase-like metal-dependent hydrolase (beta-lactamase superfamily II)
MVRPLARLAVLVCAGVMAASGLDAQPPVWRIYAIRYATLPAFPVRALIASADTARTLDLAMVFWLMQGPGRRQALLDAGFYRDKFITQWKPAHYVRPDSALLAFGVSPDSITDVIVSHVHWDHLDGADLFPHARVWIQRGEYEHYVKEDGTPADRAIDSVDALMLKDLEISGRLRLVEGDAREILPGVTAYIGGRHTYMSQYLAVRGPRGKVVLASDNVYLYENLEKDLPIAQTLDASANLAAQARMRRIAGKVRRIVPGHDPAMFTRYPAAGKNAVRIE